MVKYQGEEYKTSPTTLTCMNFHSQLFHFPKDVEWFNIKKSKPQCHLCNQDYVYYLINKGAGYYLWLIDDKKLQQAEQESSKIREATEKLEATLAEEKLEAGLKAIAIAEDVKAQVEKEAEQKRLRAEKERLDKLKKEKNAELRILREKAKEAEQKLLAEIDAEENAPPEE